ncbi:MAG: putative toxin-antitoxin system toxin component, PIN family [Acaryochloris sp. SU_5_25]|nr:putative toxin-antitoxin system toxin component, PIN family [Acaryochloris sp. SU_5_25]NJR55979.1 putative toxin-antitoxin system toxin component, PIN family [Acaryochloris sp. CRU_2_0]
MTTKIVVDTSVFISALIEPSGSSRKVVRCSLQGQFSPLMSNALFCEYESVIHRDSVLAQCPLSQDDILTLTQGMSINKLMEEPSTIALAEFDTYNRFKVMAAMGNSEEGLAILDKLDRLTD